MVVDEYYYLDVRFVIGLSEGVHIGIGCLIVFV